LPRTCGVEQRKPAVDALRGTNGKMIDLLMTHSDIKTIAKGINVTPLWQWVLSIAIEEKLDAVIDTGSLLAGLAQCRPGELRYRRGRFRP
jgi:hypothetical protein